MSQMNPSKRKSSSHHSDRVKRLAQNGIHIEASALLQTSSKDLCDSYLEGNLTPGQYPCYPPEKIPRILLRIQTLNEARLQRDVTPWVVPSAENLFFSGVPIPDYIGEEIQADWSRCATMGGTRPKPDYTVGLLPTAFTKEEVAKLQNYTSLERPFCFTPNLCFPFLICEAKTGQDGLDKAARQNIHSASLSVRAIIVLYQAVFGAKDQDRVNELYGQVLAFTVSHNNKLVNLYGHYAVLSNDTPPTLNFYRYDIAMFSLTMYNGADRYKAYNFVRNVYEKFAPEHRKRIQTAAAFLPTLANRTGLSFGTSDLALDETDSQENSQDAASQNDGVFKKPGEPASTSQIRKQMEQEKKAGKIREEKMEQQVIKLLQQMEQQKLESKEREEKQERQSKEREEKQERQSKEREEKQERQSKEREEKLERQLKAQMEQLKQQVEQQQEIISLLKQPRI
ncbi:MAG: hypothetical protein M1826_006834 [Phylliscum demangeonii]|nr:MAG: hypothetical protein M1826_006834 [Phylliscum demangeonii]